jgi:hypothetical protein
MSVSTITSSDTPLALLSKVLAEGCLSSDDLVKFQVAVSAYVLSPAARQSLHQEIKKLSVAVMSIENDFATVFIRLKEVDKDNPDVVVDQEKRPIEYASKWEVLHNVCICGTVSHPPQKLLHILRNTHISRSNHKKPLIRLAPRSTVGEAYFSPCQFCSVFAFRTPTRGPSNHRRSFYFNR